MWKTSWYECCQSEWIWVVMPATCWEGHRRSHGGIRGQTFYHLAWNASLFNSCCYAVPVHAGYMPSLAVSMAAANPTEFLRQALQSITHTSPKVAITVIFLLQMTKKRLGRREVKWLVQVHSTCKRQCWDSIPGPFANRTWQLYAATMLLPKTM